MVKAKRAQADPFTEGMWARADRASCSRLGKILMAGIAGIGAACLFSYSLVVKSGPESSLTSHISVGLLGTFVGPFAVYGYNLCAAPFRQRREARAELARSRPAAPEKSVTAEQLEAAKKGFEVERGRFNATPEQRAIAAMKRTLLHYHTFPITLAYVFVNIGRHYSDAVKEGSLTDWFAAACHVDHQRARHLEAEFNLQCRTLDVLDTATLHDEEIDDDGVIVLTAIGGKGHILTVMGKRIYAAMISVPWRAQKYKGNDIVDEE